MNAKISTTAAVISAFFSSLCCAGPLILMALGVGASTTGFLAGLSSGVKALVPYRPVFIAITFLLLGIGFASVYRRESGCAPDSACAGQGAKKKNMKAALWVCTSIAVVLVSLPYLLAMGS